MGRRAWSRCGVRYVRSELPKSQIYLECLPLFARGLVALPDHKRLLRELRLLERHTHRSGRDTVDHGKNGSDDYSNAVCGVLRDLSTHLSYLDALTRALATKWKTPTAKPPRATRDRAYRNEIRRAHLCAQRRTMLAEVTHDEPREANHILRLSDSQLAIVRQAAVPLSPSARDRYLKTVAAELAEAERVDDATVKAMVETRPCAR